MKFKKKKLRAFPDLLRLKTEAPNQPESIKGGPDTLEMEQISGLNTFDFAKVVTRHSEGSFSFPECLVNRKTI